MILVTRPNHDNGTNYLCYWSKLVIDEAKNRGIGVTDLLSKKANRFNLLSYYKKHKHRLLFLNGHGFDNLITGYDDELLMDNGKNSIDLNGSLIVARSCRCANILGKFLVQNGVVAFVGYKDDYVVKTSRKYTTRPLMDPMAALFLKPSNIIVESLLKGNTVEVANNKSRKLLAKNISKVLIGKSKDKDDTAKYLYHDFKNQIVIGDSSAKL